MRIVGWIEGRLRVWRRGLQKASSRRYGDELFPDLFVRQLEDRRVLNGTALPLPWDPSVAEPTLDAGAMADDGLPDTFYVVRQGDEVHVSVNGEEVYAAPLAEIDNLTLNGSSDADTLIVDFSGGDPFPDGGIVFNGMDSPSGGEDCVLIERGSFAGPIDTVTHRFDRVGDGFIHVAWDGGDAGSPTSGLLYSGVESIVDTTAPDQLVFQLAPGSETVTISDAGSLGDGDSMISSSGGTVVTFAAPAQSLVVETDVPGDGGSDAIDVDGLDSAFAADLTIRGDADDTIRFTGSSDLGGGDLTATAGTIDVEGAITSQGATVHLDGGGEGTLTVTGTIDVSDAAPAQAGGTVHLLGDQVFLLDGAYVDASGDAGGGTVLVGGDYQGNNPAIPNATLSYVASGAVIRADALTDGDGGWVIIWADQSTYFYGQLTARGGSESGDGGFAEISGKTNLVQSGSVDLRAPQGATGTLLLDPLDIEIRGGTADGSDDPDPNADVLIHGTGSNTSGTITFSDDGSTTPFVIYESEIEQQSKTASIVLEAANSITTSGTFNHDADGAWAADPGTNVVLIQNGNSLTLRTRNDAGDGTGGIDLTDGGSLNNLEFKTTGSGTITIQTGNDGAGGGGSAVGEAPVTLGKLTSAGGQINVASEGTLTLNGHITSAGGAVTLTVTGAGQGIAVGAAISAGTGNVELTTGPGGVLSVAASGSITTTGSGQILLRQDDLVLDTTSALISSADGNVVLEPVTPGRPIDLGAADAATTGLEISDGELDRVVITGTGVLVVGSTSAGDVVLSSNIHPDGAKTLRINSGGSLTPTTQANTITVNKLAIEVDDEIGSSGARISAAVRSLAAESEVSGDIYLAIRQTGSETVGGVKITTVDGLSGITTAGSDIDIEVLRDLTIDEPITAAGDGDIKVVATRGGSIYVNANLTDSGGDNTIVLDAASRIVQTPGTLISGQALRLTAGSAIGTDAAPILTQVAEISAVLDSSSATGGIFITETDAVAVTEVDGQSGIAATNNQSVRLETLAGTITVLEPVTAEGSGNVTLTANGAASDLGVSADIQTASGELWLSAGESITTDGTGTIIATSDGSGTLRLDAAETIGTQASPLQIDVATVAAQVTGATTEGVFLNQVDGHQGDLVIGTAGGLEGITAPNGGKVEVVTQAGTLHVVQPITADDDISLEAKGASSDIITASATGDIHTTGGGISLTAGRSITLGDRVQSDGGLLVWIKTGTANTGVLTLAGGQASSGSIVTDLADVQIETHDLVLEPGTQINAYGSVTIGPPSGRDIDLGSDTPGRLGITDAELDQITAQFINIGGGQGNLTLSADINPANVDTLLIDISGSLTTTAEANTITVERLGIAASGSIGAPGARISTNVTELAADNSGAGGIHLAEQAGGVTITAVHIASGLESQGGDIDLTVVGDLAVETQILASGDGDIRLVTTGGGDIHVDSVIEEQDAANTIVLDADGQIVYGTASSIKGQSLRLTAGEAIGTPAAPVRTEVAELSAALSHPAATGGIFITESDAVAVTTVDGQSGITTTNDQSIWLETRAGTLTVLEPIRAHGSGNVTLTAIGASSDIAVGADVQTASGDLVLDAGQSITTDGTGTIIATSDGSGTLRLDAAEAIGTSANRLQIDVATVAAQVTGAAATGGIFLEQVGGYQGDLTIGTASGLGGISTTNNNDISVQTEAGTLTVAQPVVAHGSGNVTLTAGGASSDLITYVDTGDILSGSGAIVLTAGRAVTLSDRVETGGGSVTLTTGTGDTGLLTLTSGGATSGSIASGGGAIVIGADDIAIDNPAPTAINAGTGRVTIRPTDQTDAARQIDLGTDTPGRLSLTADELDVITTTGVVQIGDTFAGDVILSADISPANFSTLRINSSGSFTTTAEANTITVDSLAIEVDDEIGAGGSRISTSVASLAAESEVSGGVYLAELADGVTVTTVDGLAGITAGGGDIELTVVGDLRVEQNITNSGATGKVNLTASEEIALGAQVSNQDGDLNVLAVDDVTFGADGAITSIGGAVTVTADSDGVGDGTSGALVMANTSSIEAGDGPVDLAADEDVTLATVRTTATLTVTSTSGQITDTPDATITAGGAATLSAAADITLGDSGATNPVNFGSLSLTGAAVSITEGSSTLLTGVNVDSLHLTSDGAIEDATDINVAGEAVLDAGTNPITLGDQPGDTTNFGSLELAGGAVTISEDSDTLLVGADVGSLKLTSAGQIEIGRRLDGSPSQQAVKSTGPIDLEAAGDLYVYNIPSLAPGESEVVGSDITADAGGTIIIENEAVLESATGKVTNVPPVLEIGEKDPDKVLVPGDTVQSLAGTAGGIPAQGDNVELGENFTVVIVWDDGIQSDVPGVDSGQQLLVDVAGDGSLAVDLQDDATNVIELELNREYTVIYLAGLGRTEVFATVTLENDPNIRLSDSSGVDLNRVSYVVATSVATGEFTPRGLAVAPDEPEPIAPEEPPLVPPPPPPVPGQPPSRFEEIRLRSEEVVEDQRRLYIVKVGPDGAEGERQSLPIEALSDLSALLEKLKQRKLPNGLYRIYLEEVGFPRRKVMEFYKSGETLGEPVREPGRGSQPIPDQPSQSGHNGEPSGRARHNSPDLADFAETQAAGWHGHLARVVRQHWPDASATRPVNPAGAAVDHGESADPQACAHTSGPFDGWADSAVAQASSLWNRGHRQDACATVASAVLAAGSVAAYSALGRWDQRIDQAMEDSDEKSFSKASRLCRRFRR